MDLSNLVKSKNIRAAKRIGRGESSGKGKTSGKGYKGQKARGSVRLGFEGGQLPIIKRLPFKRGVGNNLAVNKLTITLEQLKNYAAGEIVNAESLVKKGLIKKAAKHPVIKVVAKGEIDRPLKIHILATAKAKELIEKVKGEVISFKKPVAEEKGDV